MPGPDTSPPDAHPWLRVEEAAELLKVSARTVYNLVRRGDLPHERIGNRIRIKRQDVVDFGDRR